MAEEGNKKQAIEALKKLESYIANNEERTDEIEGLVNKVLEDYDSQFKLILVSLTKARIGRVSKLVGTLESIEDELSSEEKMKEMSPSQLLQAQHNIGNSLKGIIDLVNMVNDMDLKYQQTGQVNNYQVNVYNEGVPEDKDRRERVRKQLSEIFEKVDQTVIETKQESGDDGDQ